MASTDRIANENELLQDLPASRITDLTESHRSPTSQVPEQRRSIGTESDLEADLEALAPRVGPAYKAYAKTSQDPHLDPGNGALSMHAAAKHSQN